MQKFFPKLLLFTYFFIISATFAQNDSPSDPAEGEYIKEWLVLGPFPPYDLSKDFLLNAGGENYIEPSAGDIVVTERGDTLTWKRVQAQQNIINLLKIIGNYQNVTTYAFCNLKSKGAVKKKIMIGSDDGVAVWINGERVFNNRSIRPLLLDQDSFEINLKEGLNSCLVKITQFTYGWGFAMRILPHNLNVSLPPKYFISSDLLEEGSSYFNVPWKYFPGDNLEWAASDYDDKSWGLIYPELRPDQFTDLDWPGVGWFRLHIVIDSALIDLPLGISIWQAGSSQLYLDGKLLYNFDEEMGNETRIPKVISFRKDTKHVLAIRYSNVSADDFFKNGYNAGFSLWLGNLDLMTNYNVSRENNYISFQIFFTTLSIAIGLLHFILFIFYPNMKPNLYFALFLFSYAAAIFFDYQILLSTNIGEDLYAFRMHCLMLPFWLIFQLSFIYSLFYDKIPKQFWIIALILICFGAVLVYRPKEYFELFGIIAYWGAYAEIIRVIVFAFIKKIQGRWIITIAFTLFLIFGLLDALMDAGIILFLREIENPYAFGSVVFFLAMSVYLSRDFARTNKKLAEQTVEQKLLEAENERQSKELEGARQLQLSMLPKELPKHPNLDIGVYMKTATEVGGDYYDFKQHLDGTLTVVVGDATGHGMQAGTMVAATKSLFHALAEEPSPVSFLQNGTKAIKAMGLRKMFMALTLAKFKDSKLLISSAGMPFPLIYRFSTGQVEEIVLKGMPLGGTIDFPYKEKIVQLYKGDTVLFLSDGFEEMFNPENEILGSEKVKNLFQESATNPSQKIIEHLRNAGELWANGRDQEDDVTFVILKVK